MATNHPTAPLLTRSDVILLHTLTNLRYAEVSTKANEHRARWQSAPAGSDDLLDATACDSVRIQGE